MNETILKKFGLFVALSVLAIGLFIYAGIGGALIIIAMILIALSVFAESVGVTGKKMRIIFGVVGILLFLLSWSFTAPTAKWALHKAQQNAPRETFDPTSPTTDAAAKFMREADGTLRKVPVEWKRDPRTGIALTEPGTPEFWELINEYETQEARKRAEEKNPPQPSPTASNVISKTDCFTIKAKGRYTVDPDAMVGGTQREVTWTMPTAIVEVWVEGGTEHSCIVDPKEPEYCTLNSAGSLTFKTRDAAAYMCFTAMRTG